MGPGKADLLDAINATGSISAAGRRLSMSYKRAWDLVNIMNGSFKESLISTSVGGNQGGGAVVTDFGLKVLAQYRTVEAKANVAVADEVNHLLAMLNNP